MNHELSYLWYTEYFITEEKYQRHIKWSKYLCLFGPHLYYGAVKLRGLTQRECRRWAATRLQQGLGGPLLGGLHCSPFTMCTLLSTKQAYLIFVRNAVNAVSVKVLAECKKIPEKKTENYCFGLRLYRSSNVLFYTKCVIYIWCVILHSMCNVALSVKFYTQCVILHPVKYLIPYA